MPRALRAAILALLVMLTLPERASAAGGCPRLGPWHRVGESLEHFATPLPLALVALSPLPLVTLGPTGGDHTLRRFAQRELGGSYHLEPVSYFAPFVLAGAAVVGFSVGAALGVCELERPFSAVLQGMAGGLIATGALKIAVGREWPNAGKDPHAPDRLSHPENAERYRPFRLRLGAWPSGHTLSMMAAAAAFRGAEQHLGAWRFVGYPLAAGVAAGMWLGDRHWGSDILSGALLGEAIGGSVGESFARTSDHAPNESGASSPFTATFLAMPLDGGGLVGWIGTW